MARKLSRKRRSIYYRKYRRDPNIKTKETLNRLLRHLVKGKECPKIMDLLGCSRDNFIKYIESQFSDEMNWSNYGTSFDLDHVVPCKIFNLTNLQDQLRCYHYTNFRPLCKTENKRRNKKHVNN